MLCNYAEYKKMDQDMSIGQLYDVQNWIKILYKQSGWAYSFPTTLCLFCRGVIAWCRRKKVSNIDSHRSSPDDKNCVTRLYQNLKAVEAWAQLEW